LYVADLRKQNITVAALSFPGRELGTLGRVIYDLHHDPHRYGIAELTAESLQALHVAAHLDAIDRLIRPRIERGETVMLDRYWWSTWVYGIDAGAKRETIDALIECERQHWGTLKPEVVILVTRRDSLRPADAGESWERRMRLYAQIANQESERYPVRAIDNDSTEAEALSRIHATVDLLRNTTTQSTHTLNDAPDHKKWQ
jgi:thymidylate kinase